MHGWQVTEMDGCLCLCPWAWCCPALELKTQQVACNLVASMSPAPSPQHEQGTWGGRVMRGP